MTPAGESAKAEPTLKEVIEGLKIHLEVAHEYHTPSGSMERGCDHEEEIKSAITALEASSPPAAERTALKAIRDRLDEARTWHRNETRKEVAARVIKTVNELVAEFDAQERAGEPKNETGAQGTVQGTPEPPASAPVKGASAK